MATNNPVQLLISLGVNNESAKRNIQSSLDTIKKDLRLEIDIKSTANTNNSIQKIHSDIDALRTKIKELNKEMSSVGSSNVSNGKVSGLTRDLTSAKESIKELQKEINKLKANEVVNTKGLKDAQREIVRLNTELTNLRNGANSTRQSTNGLANSLTTAFKKFSIWMTASTIFYGIGRSVNDMKDRVIELDTAMTDLRRVMDVPEYAFNTVLERAIENVDKLSGKTLDYMKLVGEFGRTGMDDVQSIDMANTATLLQNISELTADEAFSSLTAAMISFGIAAEDSLEIANKLNQVDNDYAITTRDLSLSLNKAASTAKTFGVSLDELLGYTTAIGAATRESGSVVGNSLKTIFSRITTNTKAIGALNDVGISINDLEGNVRPVTAILDELAGKWDTLSDAQRQNTSVGVSGIYQLSRFNALMLNYDMAQKATTTSVESFNSAMSEQEKYNKSLEARINRLDTAWTSLSSTVGDKVLYDGIVVVTEGLNKLADDGESAVSGVGALAPAFGLIGMAAYGLSGGLRGLIASTYATVSANVAATGSTGLYATALTGLGTVANITKVALRGLLIATGVGAAFAVVGFAIEKVVNVMSDLIQKQEELDLYNEKNITALTENKDKTEELLISYDRLSKAKVNGNAWSTEKEEEYLQIQQTLSEIYPALVGHIDSTGQAHLKNSDAIEKELETTKELIDAQNKLTLSKASEEFDKLKTSMDGKWFESFGNYITGSLESRIKDLRQVIATGMKNGVDTSKWEVDLINLEQQYQFASEEIKSHIYEVIAASASLNDVTIDNNITKTIRDVVQNLDLSNLDSDELELFTKNLGNLQEQLQSSVGNKDENLFDSTIEGLNKLASETKDFEVDINGFKISYGDLMNIIANNGNSINYVEGEVSELGETLDASGEKAESLADKMYDLGDAVEQMVGVSEKGTEALDDLIWQYDTLSMQLAGYTEQQLRDLLVKENLTAEEQRVVEALSSRTNVMQQMSSLYPDLLGKDGKAIEMSKEKREAIEQENKANKILLEAYKLSRDGKLTAEQDMTLASAQQTKNRIDNIRAEIDALNILNKVLQEYANNAAMTTDENAGRGAMRASMIMASNVSEIGSYESELNKLQNSLFSTTGEIKTFTDSINESDKSKKESNKTTKESTYVTDEYKNKLEELNLAIERQQKLLEQYPKHSSAYRKAKEEEIKLQKQKLALIEKEEKALNAQIKAGNIKQTGLISTESATTSTTKTTTSSAKVSGWSGRLTSPQGNRTNPVTGKSEYHNGIDLASPLGTRLDANYGGKVIASGSAKSQGYDSSYGNIVVVQDDSGNKHLYAHLEKAIAKLGSTISAGTQVGTIGSTGNSTGSHLHYNVKNSSGKNLDAATYAKQARNGAVQSVQQVSESSSGDTKSASTIQAENEQAIDKAKSELLDLQGNIISQKEIIENLYKDLRTSVLASYGERKSDLDSLLGYEDSKLKSVDKSSERYGKTLDRQTKLLNDKQKVNKEELAYLESLVKAESISLAEKDEYENSIASLKTEMMDTTNAISEMSLAYLELYDARRITADNSLAYEAAKLAEVDTNSNRYILTLQKMTTTMSNKQKVNSDELLYLDKQIKSGKHSGTVLADLKQRYSDLTTEVKSLSIELRNLNYDILSNINARVDEKIDDKDFSLQRSKIIQGMYEVGSADYMKEYDYQIKAIKELMTLEEGRIAQLQKDMKNVDLLPDDIKELNEKLEDATLAVLNYKNEVLNTEKALADTRKSRNDDLVNSLLDSWKDYYSERKDAQDKALDKDIEAENKRHKTVVKNIEVERDKFKEAIDDRLRQLERTEAERSYDMDIDDLESQRNALQEQIARLLMDGSREAKAKRKALQEELDKLDKDIEAKRHERQIELQKQGLSDLSELKDKEIEDRIEAENTYHDSEIEKIDKLKVYWDQHYTDLMNDERKFAKIREDIINGNFEEIRGEFGGFADWLEGEMPSLENNLDGTMQAVGTSIRQNIIGSLKEALDLMNQVRSSTSTTTGQYGSSTGSDNAGGNFTNPDPAKNSNGMASLSNADMKVLLGKYLTEKIAPTADSTVRKANIREKAYALASEGRIAGSTISANAGLESILGGLGEDDIKKLSSFVSSNASSALQTPEYQQMLKDWASKMRNGAASLDTGGMLNFKGGGVDGKGGRFIIGHPDEVVNSPLDTKRLIDMSSITQRAAEMFTPVLKAFANPSSLLSNLNNVGGDTIEMNFNIGEMIANKQSADALGNRIWNDLRVKKGMR